MGAAGSEGDATTAAREHGWGPTVAALLACLAVAAAPLWPPAAGLVATGVRLAVPVEQTMLLLVPAIAACTVVGWWAGGRLPLMLAWVALAGWVLVQPLPAQAPGYAALARGWSLVVASAFGVVSIVAPHRRFFPRALSAIGIAAATGLVALLVAGRDPGRLSAVMTAEYGRRVESSLAGWRRHTTDATWRSVADRSPEFADRAQRSARALQQLPPAVATLVPALVALESLAALALGWGLYHRLSRTRIGRPLVALRSFRFNDQLVWGIVVGATFALVPSLAALRPLGANLLLFFGALYALRGLGIVRWWAPERWTILGGLGVALLLPVLGVTLLGGVLGILAALVGLGDTWQDWRRRRPGSPA